VDFSLVDHHGSLLVVECLLALDYLRVRLTDNCDNEVHEYHKQEEDAADIQQECKEHDFLRVEVEHFTIISQLSNIEPHCRVDQAEISHRQPQHRDQMSEESRYSSIRFDVDLNYMEGLCEGEQEDGEQDHEIVDFLDDCDEHSDQEVQLPEDPDQIDDLHQGKQDTEAEHHLHGLGRGFFLEVEVGTP